MNRIVLLSTFFFSLLFSCQKNNVCDGVQCQNGGVCVSGNCDCPPGYEGNRCQIEMQPTAITIQTVRVLYFPLYNTMGQAWDTSDGPDLYLQIKDAGQVIYTSEIVYNNASGNNGAVFEFSPNLGVFYPSRPLTFVLLDRDNLAASDIVGAIESKIYQPGEKFPSAINVHCSECKTAFEVTVKYEW